MKNGSAQLLNGYEVRSMLKDIANNNDETACEVTFVAIPKNTEAMIKNVAVLCAA
jgi:hypothetical protein